MNYTNRLHKSATYVDSVFELVDLSSSFVIHIAVSSSEIYRFSDLSSIYLTDDGNLVIFTELLNFVDF